MPWVMAGGAVVVGGCISRDGEDESSFLVSR